MVRVAQLQLVPTVLALRWLLNMPFVRATTSAVGAAFTQNGKMLPNLDPTPCTDETAVVGRVKGCWGYAQQKGMGLEKFSKSTSEML